VEGWSVDDPLYEYGAPVSALAVNDNAFALRVRPGARVGDPGVIVLDPPVEYYAIDNRVRTSRLGVERKIHVERNASREQLRVWGTFPLRDRGETVLLGVADPALYAAKAFRQILEQRGIAVSGGLSARHLFANEVADLAKGPAARPPSGVELARRASAPLLESLRIIGKVSQNLHAEMMLRSVARERRGIGSQEAGLEELETFMAEAGLAPESYNLVDASGLARLNLVSPTAIVRLLRYMYSAPEREEWMSLLPIGGQDGTLSDRFGEPGAAGRILAKTGTLSHVSALSGYARRGDGAWLAFSILANNYNGPAADIRGVMDRICTLMIE
jgi:D-alanyl-D-alanine carboxypeptidase/D-alanyl-D-alanine-endopeptidase (penicillin-binding protein 4)